MRLARVAAGLLLAVLPLAGAPAQPPAAPGAPDQDIIVNLGPEGLTIDEFVHLVNKHTGRVFVFDDQKFKSKKFKMVGSKTLPQSQAYQFYQTLFRAENLALVPIGPKDAEVIIVEDLATAQFLKNTAVFVLPEDVPGMARDVGIIISTVYPLRYVDVGSVRAALSQVTANKATNLVVEIQSANSLLLTDFAPNVNSMLQLLKQMDVPAAANIPRFEKIHLKYAAAEELVQILRELISARFGAQSQGAAQGGGGGRRAPIPQPDGTVRPAGATGGRDSIEPQIIADPRTNSIVVYAADDVVEELRRLVDSLDVEVKGIESNIHVYPLVNSNAAELADVIDNLLRQSTRASARGRPAGITGAQGAAPTTIGSPDQEEVTIVADRHTNSLVITATKTRYQEIEDLIRRLDKRRPQVLVQAAIAELSDTDLDQIGTEVASVEDDENGYFFATAFGLTTIDTGTTTTGGSSGTGGTGTGTGGGSGATGTTSGPSSIFDSFRRLPNTSLQGLLTGFFEDDQIQVPLLVHLFRRLNKSNLISVPSVLTNDNEEAKFKVSRQVPTTTTNQGQVTTETGFGGYQEAKLELRISPHISNNDYLRLEVYMLVEAFVGAQLDPAIPPEKTTREIEVNVTVPNGRTVVIGGLITDNDIESTTMIPLLGEIPILGWLFRNTETRTEKTTIYIFITPHIFPSDSFEGLERISYEKKLEMQRLNARVRLVDPDFREVDLENQDVKLDDIERSGNLDLPRYRPIAPMEEIPPGGPPVMPRAESSPAPR